MTETKAAREQAVELFVDQGPRHLGCSQAVLYCGLLLLDKDTELCGIGTFFGGGVARMGQLCGAISGAAIALGLRDCLAGEKDPQKREETQLQLQALMREFEDRFGALTCRDLLGYGDLSDREAMRHAKTQGALKRCPDFVSFVCDRLGALFESSEDRAAPSRA